MPKAFDGHALKFASWRSLYDNDNMTPLLLRESSRFLLSKLDKQSIIRIITTLYPSTSVAEILSVTSEYFSKEDVLLNDVKRRIEHFNVKVEDACSTDDNHFWESLKSELKTLESFMSPDFVRNHEQAIVQQLLTKVSQKMLHDCSEQPKTFAALHSFIDKQMMVNQLNKLKRSNSMPEL